MAEKYSLPQYVFESQLLKLKKKELNLLSTEYKHYAWAVKRALDVQCEVLEIEQRLRRYENQPRNR